jgi:ketosteroid isomerase-like protein
MVIKKLIRSLVFGTLCCFPVATVLGQDAQSYGTWGFDSIKRSTAQRTPESDPSDYQKIYSLLVNMADRWNAHDIDGYLSAYWQSPDLLVVIAGEQLKGWADVLSTYRRGYTSRDEMGTLIPERIQIQMVSADVAVGLDWWTAVMRKGKVLGTSTMVLRKIDGNWVIVVMHSSFVEP